MSNDQAVPTNCDDQMAEVERRFAVRVTDAVRQSIISLGDAVARQYLPDIRELNVDPAERPDPIGDKAHSPCKGLVHRHQNRVLFKASSVCAVNCRFCFRKTMLGTPEETLSRRETDEALTKLRSRRITDHRIHQARRALKLFGDDFEILAARKDDAGMRGLAVEPKRVEQGAIGGRAAFRPARAAVLVDQVDRTGLLPAVGDEKGGEVGHRRGFKD